MSDSFTEISRIGWFGRIKNALVGVLFGLLFILIGFVLLFWNEGRAVKTAKALEEGQGVVVSIRSHEVDPSKDGKLVHLSGYIETDQTIQDPVFGVQVEGLVLKRKVEMYQWVESKKSTSKKEIGGGEAIKTTYSYQKQWSSFFHKSKSFKEVEGHENPSDMKYKKQSFTTNKAYIDEFRVPKNLLKKINDFESVSVRFENLPDNVQNMTRPYLGGIYIGEDPDNPQVGDYKIQFQMVPSSQRVTIVAQQAGNSFEAYRTSNGKEIEMLRTGRFSAEEMFVKAQEDNAKWTWGLRVGGWFAIFLGLWMVLGPLSVLGDVIPLLGSLIGGVAGFVAFLLSLCIAFLIIALAWLSFRPLIGFSLLAVAILSFVAIPFITASEDGKE